MSHRTEGYFIPWSYLSKD